MTILAARTIITGERVVDDGWLEITDGRVRAVGTGPAPSTVDVDLGDRIVVPGFVDLHVHGGGGGSFDGSVIDITRAVSFHAGHGTTTTLASLVTAEPADLLARVERLADLTEAGLIAGSHLEGPWLAERRSGAHQVSALRDPEADELTSVFAAGRGTIRMITFAPERAGALEAIRLTVDQGIVAAVGHTDASYAVTRAAIEAGARVATHLFNAIRPLHQREPGPIAALLEDPRVTVELIVDGFHLHPAIYRQVVAAAGADRIALVSDAMAATGLPDGDYQLGALDVSVVNGQPRLSGTDTIAGSTATSDHLFRCAVAAGASVLDVVRQTSVTPALVLGLTDRHLEVGGRADLVVLDRELAVVDVRPVSER